MQLLEIKELNGIIELKSGLHIGSGDMEMHIGGTDSPVIKHPHTLQPYIPGSSLKGKVRSLLEMKSGLMQYTYGKVVSSSTLKDSKVKDDKKMVEEGEIILKIFGTSGADNDEEVKFGPTRVSFSDCYIDKDWLEEAKEYRWVFTEEKAENVINRISGTADNPRFIERVPSGVKFNFKINYKVFNIDCSDAEKKIHPIEDYILTGLKLLEMDTLGGNGSRGYGRIKFKFDNDKIKSKFNELTIFNA